MKLSVVVIGLSVLVAAGCNSADGGSQGRRPGKGNPTELHAAGEFHRALALLGRKASLSVEEADLRENCVWSLYERHRFTSPDSAHFYLRKATPDGPLWKKFKVEFGHESELDGGESGKNLCWGAYSLSQARKLTRSSVNIKKTPNIQYLEGTGPYLLACAITGESLNPNILAASVDQAGGYYPAGPDEFRFQKWMSSWEESLRPYATALRDSNLFCVGTDWLECGEYDRKTGSFPVDVENTAVEIMSKSDYRPADWNIVSILPKQGGRIRTVSLDVAGQGVDLARLVVPVETAEALTRFWRESSSFPRRIAYWVVFAPLDVRAKDAYHLENEGVGPFTESRRVLHREMTIRTRVAAVFAVVSGSKLFPTCTMLKPEDVRFAQALSSSRWGGANSQQVLKVLFPRTDETMFGAERPGADGSGAKSAAAGHTAVPFRLNWDRVATTQAREDITAAEYVPGKWRRPDYLDGANYGYVGYRILIDAAEGRSRPFIPDDMADDEFARQRAVRAYGNWYEYYRDRIDRGELFVFEPTSKYVVMGVYDASRGGAAIVDAENKPFTWSSSPMPGSEADDGREISHTIRIVNAGSWATWLPMERSVAEGLVSSWRGAGRPQFLVLCLGRVEGASRTSQIERVLRVNARALVYTDMMGNVLGVLTPPK